jgi:hypothetical protein
MIIEIKTMAQEMIIMLQENSIMIDMMEILMLIHHHIGMIIDMIPEMIIINQITIIPIIIKEISLENNPAEMMIDTIRIIITKTMIIVRNTSLEAIMAIRKKLLMTSSRNIPENLEDNFCLFMAF